MIVEFISHGRRYSYPCADIKAVYTADAGAGGVVVFRGEAVRLVVDDYAATVAAWTAAMVRATPPQAAPGGVCDLVGARVIAGHGNVGKNYTGVVRVVDFQRKEYAADLIVVIQLDDGRLHTHTGGWVRVVAAQETP